MAFNRLNRWLGYAGLARDGWRAVRAGQETKQQAQKHLAARLGRLRGLPQKIGQMLSLAEDEATAAAFAPLREHAPALPWQQIKPRLQQEWGCEVRELFSWIDPIGKGASLGQVHRGEMKSGTNVAVKIQYPGMRTALATDLNSLGWLSLPLGGLGRGFDLADYQHTLLTSLEQELDYRQEAAQQEACRSAWQEIEEICVPRVQQDLTTENVLVTEWQDGDSWNDVCQRWPLAAKEALAETLVRWWIHSYFRSGMVHADLHPGNLRFRRVSRDVQIVVFDFGSVQRVSSEEQQALADLIAATEQGSDRLLAEFLRLGFDYDKLRPLEAKLPALCRVLLAPFLAEGPFQIHTWNLGEQVQQILGDDRWNFRLAGPPGLMFLLRSLHGMLHYLTQLKVAVDWRSLMQKFAPPPTRSFALPLLNEPIIPAQLAKAAEHLRIRVSQQGETRVQLTFPARAVENLADLMGEELLARIQAQGIQLAQIAEQVRQSDYAPGPLFELTTGDKRAAVWLE